MQPQQQSEETNNRHLTTGRDDQQQKKKNQKRKEAAHSTDRGGGKNQISKGFGQCPGSQKKRDPMGCKDGDWQHGRQKVQGTGW